MGLLSAGQVFAGKASHKCTNKNLLNDIALNGRVQANPNCVLTKEQAETGFNIKETPRYNYLSFNFEPCIAVNPTDPDNMIATTHVSSLSREVPIFYTLNGGRTWQWVEIPNGRCQAPVVDGALNDFGTCSDPWVTFDKCGNAYATFPAANFLFTETSSTTLDTGALVFKSTDKGQSWNAPLRPYYAFGRANLPDKPAIYGSTQERDTVFLTYHNDSATVTTYQRSIDGGNFFEDPIVFRYEDVPLPKVFVWGAAVTTLPNGNVVLSVRNSLLDTNLDIGYGPGHNEQIYINISNDGGKTFGPTIIALPDATQCFADDRPNGYAVRDTAVWHDIALNSDNGYLYIVTQDSSFYPFGEPDGFEFLGAGSVIIMSKDGGLTWSEKIPVNPTSTDFQAYMATVAVLKDGTVGVFYYTDRNHTYEGDNGSEFLQTDCYLSLFDKDLNYLGEKRVTPESFNLRRAPVSPFVGLATYQIGDYQKCGSTGKEFVCPLSIPKSDVAPGFPLPPTVDEYTEITDRQFTKFARVALENGYDCHNGQQFRKSATEKAVLHEAGLQIKQRDTDEIAAARESRKKRSW